MTSPGNLIAALDQAVMSANVRDDEVKLDLQAWLRLLDAVREAVREG